MPYLKCSVATCVLFAAVCTTASAKIDRVVEKSFQVQPGVRLVASTSGGEIKVIESKDLAVFPSDSTFPARQLGSSTAAREGLGPSEILWLASAQNDSS